MTVETCEGGALYYRSLFHGLTLSEVEIKMPSHLMSWEFPGKVRLGDVAA